MKFFRKSLFWVIALVILGGVFFLADDRAREADRTRQANLRLFSFQPGDVAEFWIDNRETGLRARLVRSGEGWRLTEPPTAKGDAEAITKLLRNIVGMRKDGILFENPDAAKLNELGLAKPKLEMGLRTAGGNSVIRFGNLGPTHNVAYAMLAGDPRVYRIHSDMRREASTGIHALRDKTLLSFDPSKLRRWRLERKGGKAVTIIHDDRGRWDMIEPEVARASMSRVIETLYKIRNSKIKAFIDGPTPSPARLGLDAPRIRVIISEQGSATERLLSIGARDKTRRGSFARIGGAPRVIVVEESLVNALRADASHWKDRDDGS